MVLGENLSGSAHPPCGAAARVSDAYILLANTAIDSRLPIRSEVCWCECFLPLPSDLLELAPGGCTWVHPLTDTLGRANMRCTPWERILVDFAVDGIFELLTLEAAIVKVKMV